MKWSLGISNFLEENSSLSHSIVFLYFLALSTLEGFFFFNLGLLFSGTLHSVGYIFPFLLCLLFLFFFQVFVRSPQTTILPFCTSFSWGWCWSWPFTQCYSICSLCSYSVQFSSVAQSSVVSNSLRPPNLPIHQQLLEFTQTHVHWVGDAIQPSHPLSSPSLPTLNLSQHHGLFKWVTSSHQVAKVLEFQFQHQSFQWIFRTDFL